MLVVKLTIRARVGADEQQAIPAVQFACGGMIKRREEGGLYHTLTSDPDAACREWERLGYDLTGREEVQMDDAGLERLLEDLRKLDK